MSFNNLQVYKHDVVGKLANISSLVTPITDDDFIDKSSDEVFLAVHESILKILNTSKSTLQIRNEKPIKLIVSDRMPSKGMEVIKLGKILVRILRSDNLEFYYYTKENNFNLLFALGKIEALLPISSFVSDCSDVSICSELKLLETK